DGKVIGKAVLSGADSGPTGSLRHATRIAAELRPTTARAALETGVRYRNATGETDILFSPGMIMDRDNIEHDRPQGLDLSLLVLTQQSFANLGDVELVLQGGVLT